MTASRGRGGGGGGRRPKRKREVTGKTSKAFQVQEPRAAAPEAERSAPRALSQWLRDAPSRGDSRGTRRVAAIEDAMLQCFHANPTAT